MPQGCCKGVLILGGTVDIGLRITLKLKALDDQEANWDRSERKERNMSTEAFMRVNKTSSFEPV